MYGKSCICKECFETKIIPDTYLEYTLENSDIWVECKICKFRAKDITAHIKIVHNEKIENYKLVYGPIKSKEILDRVKGENNPAYNHGGKLSPFSKNNKNITEEQRLENLQTIIKTRTENGNNTTSLEYYLKKTNGDEIKAKELLSKRQTTFSLEICIEKFGVELGLSKWQERQEKWAKSFKKCNFSKISQELFKSIHEGYIGNVYYATHNRVEMSEYQNKEYILKLNKSFCRPDFICLKSKKIIEFDGDYWHDNNSANPTRELERDNRIKEMGYEILHIKESVYKQDKQATIDKCKKFLIQ